MRDVSLTNGAAPHESESVAPGRLDYAAAAAAAAVVTLLAAFSLFNHETYDFRLHTDTARDLVGGGKLLPHFLFEVLTAAVHAVVPSLGFLNAGRLVALAFFALAAVVVYVILRPALDLPDRQRAALVTAAGVLVVLLHSAVVLPTIPGHNLYFGYLVSNTYHNPTILLLKPLALVLFVLALRVFAPRSSWRWVAATAAVAVLSTLAKPSYAVCLLPALAVLVAIRRRQVDWRLAGLGITLPLLATLALQYYLYHQLPQGSAFVWRPFYVMTTLPSFFGKGALTTMPWLGAKLVLSSLFPLAVLLVWRRKAMRDLMLQLAWLGFAFGAACTYLLAEGFPQTGAGNFIWSGQITLFVVFVASLVFVLRHRDQLTVRWAQVSIAGAIGLQFVSGLAWYATQARPSAMSWW